MSSSAATGRPEAELGARHITAGVLNDGKGAAVRGVRRCTGSDDRTAGRRVGWLAWTGPAGAPPLDGVMDLR